MAADPNRRRDGPVGIARDLTGRCALYLETDDGAAFDLVDARGRRHYRGQGWTSDDRGGWHLVHPNRVPPGRLSAVMAGTWPSLSPRERALVQAWIRSCSDPCEPLTQADYLVDDFARALTRYLSGRGHAPPLVSGRSEALDLLRELRLRRNALLRD